MDGSRIYEVLWQMETKGVHIQNQKKKKLKLIGHIIKKEGLQNSTHTGPPNFRASVNEWRNVGGGVKMLSKETNVAMDYKESRLNEHGR